MMCGYIIDEIKFQTLWPLGLVSHVKLDPSKINLNPNPLLRIREISLEQRTIFWRWETGQKYPSSRRSAQLLARGDDPDPETDSLFRLVTFASSDTWQSSELMENTEKIVWYRYHCPAQLSMLTRYNITALLCSVCQTLSATIFYLSYFLSRHAQK